MFSIASSERVCNGDRANAVPSRERAENSRFYPRIRDGGIDKHERKRYHIKYENIHAQACVGREIQRTMRYQGLRRFLCLLICAMMMIGLFGAGRPASADAERGQDPSAAPRSLTASMACGLAGGDGADAAREPQRRNVKCKIRGCTCLGVPSTFNILHYEVRHFTLRSKAFYI